MKWKEETVKATEIEKTKLSEAKIQGDLAIILDPKINEDEDRTKILIEKFPNIKKILEDELIDGKIEYITTQTKIKSSKERKEGLKTKNTLYVILGKMEDKTTEECEKIHKVLKKLQEARKENETEKLTMVKIRKMKTETLRKYVEHVFRNEKGKIKILGKKEKNKKGKRIRKKEVEPRK